MRPPTSNWPGGKDEPNTVLCGNRNVSLEFFYSSVATKRQLDGLCSLLKLTSHIPMLQDY
jgi:hypothetical protein